MFTGIITKTGVVETRAPRFSVRVRPSFLRKLKRGDSVAVDGACLTVIKKTTRAFSADLMPETTRKTSLAKRRVGDIVNLELPATPTSFLSGHIVQGHIDGVGIVRAVREEKGSHIIEIGVSSRTGRYIAPKGSIAVNGVSLTIIGTSPARFSVGIIPHTWNETNLHRLKRGDAVNVEVDVLAKYVEQFV